MAETSFKELLGDSYKEGMTPEDVEKAVVEKYSGLQKDYDKLHTELDKSRGEVKAYADKIKQGQTDEEQAEAARQKVLEDLTAERDNLKKELDIQKYRASYIKLGYPEDLANATATATANGDFDTVLTNHEKFNAIMEQNFKAEAIKGMDRPDNSNPQKTLTKDDFKKMGIAERTKLAKENPTLFAELSK